jgi:hypothetical protein
VMGVWEGKIDLGAGNLATFDRERDAAVHHFMLRCTVNSAMRASPRAFRTGFCSSSRTGQ